MQGLPSGAPHKVCLDFYKAIQDIPQQSSQGVCLQLFQPPKCSWDIQQQDGWEKLQFQRTKHNRGPDYCSRETQPGQGSRLWLNNPKFHKMSCGWAHSILNQNILLVYKPRELASKLEEGWMVTYLQEGQQARQQELPAHNPSTLPTRSLNSYYVAKSLRGMTLISANTWRHTVKGSYKTAILRLVEDWKVIADCKETVGILSTDMNKASDSFHPALMLNKLKGYGFTEDALSLVRSYFEDHQCRINLGSIKSAWKDVKKGCPQGSLFGPLLRWKIFQNDMFFKVNNSKLPMYADYHQLYVAGKTPKNLQAVLSADIELATTWYKENLLLTNHKKYQAMTITGGPSEDTTIAEKIKETEVERINCLKLLEVYIDHKLNFSKHIQKTTKKSSQQVGVILRVRNLIPTEAKLQIFKSAVLPQPHLLQHLWHFCKASDNQKLKWVQESGLGAVYCDKTSSYEKILLMAKLPSLYNLETDQANVMSAVECVGSQNEIFQEERDCKCTKADGSRWVPHLQKALQVLLCKNYKTIVLIVMLLWNARESYFQEVKEF